MIKEIKTDLERLNQYKFIKVDGTNQERLVFINNEEVFNIFANINDERGLNPFNEYSYSWLNSFLNAFTESIQETDEIDQVMTDFEDNLFELSNSEVFTYTQDLTKWLNSNNSNVYYLTEVLEENSIKDGFDLLREAQRRAIEEAFNSFLSSLKTYLNNKYELSL
jgi:hypothetical protein